MPGSFFDTNVLLYLASDDRSKAGCAEDILRSGGTTSVQVLHEITNVSRRKMRLSWTDTHLFLSMIRRLLDVHPLTLEMHDTGIALAERHGFSTWDAMVVAAALCTDCDTLWSEDMHDGMVIEGRLRIVNPFSKAP